MWFGFQFQPYHSGLLLWPHGNFMMASVPVTRMVNYVLNPPDTHNNINTTERNTAKPSLIARFMGPTCGPSGADRTQVGPISAPWTLLCGICIFYEVCCTRLYQMDSFVTHPTVYVLICQYIPRILDTVHTLLCFLWLRTSYFYTYIAGLPHLDLNWWCFEV